MMASVILVTASATTPSLTLPSTAVVSAATAEAAEMNLAPQQLNNTHSNNSGNSKSNSNGIGSTTTSSRPDGIVVGMGESVVKQPLVVHDQQHHKTPRILDATIIAPIIRSNDVPSVDHNDSSSSFNNNNLKSINAGVGTSSRSIEEEKKECPIDGEPEDDDEEEDGDRSSRRQQQQQMPLTSSSSSAMNQHVVEQQQEEQPPKEQQTRNQHNQKKKLDTIAPDPTTTATRKTISFAPPPLSLTPPATGNGRQQQQQQQPRMPFPPLLPRQPGNGSIGGGGGGGGGGPMAPLPPLLTKRTSLQMVLPPRMDSGSNSSKSNGGMNRPPTLPPLRRQQSEPTVSSNTGRRCIFGQYWSQKTGCGGGSSNGSCGNLRHNSITMRQQPYSNNLQQQSQQNYQYPRLQRPRSQSVNANTTNPSSSNIYTSSTNPFTGNSNVGGGSNGTVGVGGQHQRNFSLRSAADLEQKKSQLMSMSPHPSKMIRKHLGYEDESGKHGYACDGNNDDLCFPYIEPVPEHLELPDVSPGGGVTSASTSGGGSLPGLAPENSSGSLSTSNHITTRSYRDFLPPQEGFTSHFLQTRSHFKRADELSPEQHDHRCITSKSSSSGVDLPLLTSTPSRSKDIVDVDCGQGSGGTTQLRQRGSAPLPPLPVPLQRFCSESTDHRTGGVYPLCAPKSILKESKYTTKTPPSTPTDPADNSPITAAGLADVFNLTKTLRKIGDSGTGTTANQRQLSRSTSSTSSSSTSSSSHQRQQQMNFDRCNRGVSFDPRITVTEFEEYFQRQWFTDADLERFRIETVLLAQKYLANHPNMIKVYNQAKMDPVTGTMRKKALFSLPALSSVDDDDIQPELQRYGNYMQNVAVHQVKKILIVDRNRLILDLFQRSLSMLFPHAKITTVMNAEDAAKLVLASYKCSPKAKHTKSPTAGTGKEYDIIIVEERLHQPLTITHTSTPMNKPVRKSTQNLPGLCSSDSSSVLSESVSADETDHDGPEMRSVVRHDSLCNLSRTSQHQGMSGSELLRKILNMIEDNNTIALSYAPGSAKAKTRVMHGEECKNGNDLAAASNTSSSSTSDTAAATPVVEHRIPLLVGVSAHPDQDSKKFYKNGADLVWGKPPPRMDDRLRDQLVSVLTKKRSPTNNLK